MRYINSDQESQSGSNHVSIARLLPSNNVFRVSLFLIKQELIHKIHQIRVHVIQSNTTNLNKKILPLAEVV